MDEGSGTQLYNSANSLFGTFGAIEVTGIEWHYFKETVNSGTTQFTTPIEYMFCNRPNMIAVGDHCEYVKTCSCNTADNSLGICSGTSRYDCPWIQSSELETKSLIYNSTYNEIVECYFYC